MKRKWKHWAVCAAIAVASAVAARALSGNSFFQFLNLKASDLQFVAERFLARGDQPSANIILVVADDKALEAFPEPRIFWHRYYAEAVRAAGQAGAKVI